MSYLVAIIDDKIHRFQSNNCLEMLVNKLSVTGRGSLSQLNPVTICNLNPQLDKYPELLSPNLATLNCAQNVACKAKPNLILKKLFVNNTMV